MEKQMGDVRMELNNKMISIINILAVSGGCTSVREMSAALTVSRRTLYYNVEKLNVWLEDHSFHPLVLQEGQIRAAFHELERIQEKMAAYDASYYVLTAKERQALIYLQTALSADAPGIESLGMMLNVSRNTIMMDISSLRSHLQSWLPGADQEIAAYFQHQMERHIRVLCNGELNFVDEAKVARIDFPSTGEVIRCPVDAILVAAGRRPNTDCLGPDLLHLLNPRGYFATDEFMRTREKRIFAAGDITGKKQLSHGAAAEAEVIIGYLTGQKSPIRYDEIPTLIYTKPQVYQIGLSEPELTGQKRTFITVSAAMDEADRFVCDREQGLIKAFVDPDTEKLLGIEAVGPYAGEWMQACSLLYSLELPVSAYLQTITPYPAYTGALEILFKRAVRDIQAWKKNAAALGPLEEAKLDKIKLFVLDMDGTIYLGSKLLPGARDFIAAAKKRGKEILFFTNNSSKSPEAYVDKLEHMGLSIEPGQLMTSGDVTIAYLKDKYPGKAVCLLGTEELENSFRKAGISLKKQGADLVVVGFDTSLTYEKLQLACDYIRGGKPYFMTHPDYNCPVENGFMPDCGAFGEAIASSTGRRPVILGKPYRPTIEMILKKTGYRREEIAFVGDRLYTDIAAGVNHGSLGLLVLSGETKREDLLAPTVRPHGVYGDIGEILS